jgi:isocitrate dehydrogenase (NAD+)
VADATRHVLDASGASIEWDPQDAGYEVWEREGTPVPDRTLESLRERRLALKGPTRTPLGGFRPVNTTFRREFDLYAGIRPSRAYEGIRTPFPGTDLVVIRMTHEDLYAGIEFPLGDPATDELRELIARTEGSEIAQDAAISIRPLSVAASERLARRAFRYAEENGRRRVTCVHKANVIKRSDGVFLDAVRRVAEGEYPSIPFDDRRVDSLCGELVMHPQEFDVMVMPLMYGDIVSDIGAGLTGGLGMAPGVNLGDDCAVFEAVHGTAPRHAGRNRVNPCGLLLSGVMLLRHVGEDEAAARVERALESVIRAGKDVTYDLKPTRDDPTAVGTKEFADAVVAAMG